MEGYFVLLGKFVKHMCADRWLLMKIILFLALTIMWLNLYLYIYIYSGPFGGAYFDYLEHLSIENVY